MHATEVCVCVCVCIDRANIAHESLRKELGSLLTIEKANSKKVELQMTSLEREIQAAVSDDRHDRVMACNNICLYRKKRNKISLKSAKSC